MFLGCSPVKQKVIFIVFVGVLGCSPVGQKGDYYGFGLFWGVVQLRKWLLLFCGCFGVFSS
jgi:hypothetical protein